MNTARTLLRIKVSDLPVGKRLGQDVYSPGGQLLLSRHTTLEAHYLQRLIEKGIEEVLIEDPAAADSSLKEPPQLIIPRYPLENTYQQGISLVKETIERVRQGRTVDLAPANDMIQQMFTTIIAENDLLIQLLYIKNKDEYTVEHSVSVALMAMLIGRLMEYCEEDIKSLGIAGFLHDIGKAIIPDDILNKPGPLSQSEFQEMKKHPVHGYRLINSSTHSTGEIIRMTILQHHERADGQGYPLQLKREQIIEPARVVSVADTFDAMISKRIYRPPLSALQATEELRHACFGQLDPEIGMKFLNYLEHFYIGKKVRLGNGEVGEIVLTYPDEPSRPLIRIGEQFVDLRKHRQLYIAEVFSN